MAPLGDISHSDFLANYWQRRPLLIRNAFPGFSNPLDGDELAGLACEEDIESRMVVTAPGPRYELRRGPFKEADFAGLGNTGWSLLVQDIDKQLDGFASFLDHFSFIPAWRMDDLMVSWAADGGSVGPHVDQYDVFLLQTEGRRRWRIGEPSAEPKFLPDHELKVLAEFAVTEEWVLEPGDMLYLPPGIPHWGIAEGACMTWSVGFRAPSQQELVNDFADTLAEVVGSSLRYADADLGIDESAGGQISPAAVDRAAKLLDDAWMQGRNALPRWFGEMVTSPKAWVQCEPPDRIAELGVHGLQRDPRARLAWLPLPERGLCLFADGNSMDVPTHLAPLLAWLCTDREFPLERLTRYLEDEDAREVLHWLLQGGQLVELNDEHNH